MDQTAKYYIGTSGWHYDHWRNVFYPPDMASKDFLHYYAERFGTVEINNSFYHLPKAETFADWRKQVPEGFIFAVKGNRYITHMKKLKDPVQPLERFFRAVDPLGPMLGPILFQMPPRWRKNTGRLSAFLDALPDDRRFAFEFRDEDWFADDTYDALAARNAAFCIYELNHRQSPLEVTADFVYIRLHGPGGPYQGDYDDETLGKWAELIGNWLGRGKDVYCYFDNDQNGYAAGNAGTLRDILDRSR